MTVTEAGQLRSNRNPSDPVAEGGRIFWLGVAVLGFPIRWLLCVTARSTVGRGSIFALGRKTCYTSRLLH